MTFREGIGKLRLDLKEHTADNQYTNKYLFYSLLASTTFLLQREAKKQLFKISGLWTKICLEMVEVNALDCNIRIPVNCKLFRSKAPINIIELDSGPLYKSLTSVDYSTNILIVTRSAALNKASLKNNPNKFAWITDNYLYTTERYPNLILLAATITFDCNLLNTQIPIPKYLEDALFKVSLENLLRQKQIPPDQVVNKSVI